jgi:hypothetical protein
MVRVFSEAIVDMANLMSFKMFKDGVVLPGSFNMFK